MTPHRTPFGAALIVMVLALAPGATAVAASPTPVPAQGPTTITADRQLDVGPDAQSVHVVWSFYGGRPDLPLPVHQTFVIDARGLAGIARIAVVDPRCTADGQVFTCVNDDLSQLSNLDYTVQADAGAALGATGTVTYTASGGPGTRGTARAKVIVGVPDLVVGKVPDVTHARTGARIDVPLRLRNIGNVATDRRIAVTWVASGGLAFDRKFSNCGYRTGADPVEPADPTSVTCVFPARVAPGATVGLSSPLAATVGAHALNAKIDYTVELLQPGVQSGEQPAQQPGGESEPGTGPTLTLVPASATGDGFEKSGATGRLGVSADSSADLAATATTKPATDADADADGWTLNLTVTDHGPAALYAIDSQEYVAEVDVVLPPHTVATDYEHSESEDSAYGPCFLWVDATTTAPFEAGHRHYVCAVPFGIGAGKDVEAVLSVKPDKSYDGAKGTATVRSGPAGIALHDPHTSNDSATFTFGAPADTGTERTALVTAAAIGAALLGGAVLVLRRRRRSH
jgi:LPXTG-motif cell wall-anchored protein